MRRTLLPLLFLLLTVSALAQRVDSTNTHYRVWAIDRVITDAQGIRMPAHAQGMLGFVAIYSPDGSLCLVEYVAAKHQDLDAVRRDRDPRVRVFEKPFTKRVVFETTARAAGFTQVNLDKFFVRVP